MTQGHQFETLGFRGCQFIQHSEGEPVYHYDGLVRDLRYGLLNRLEAFCIQFRQAGRERKGDYLKAHISQFRYKATIVAIAASRRIEFARVSEVDGEIEHGFAYRIRFVLPEQLSSDPLLVHGFVARFDELISEYFYSDIAPLELDPSKLCEDLRKAGVGLI